MKPIALAALLAAVAAPAAAPAQAAFCAPRDEIVAQLAERFGESRRGHGLQGDGRAVLELYASPESGSWTILLTRPDGVSCAVAAGEAWIESEPTATGPAA